ncbi:tubulin-like doman-containing protein [Haloplanus rubicundus]|uniref:Tubulin like n=1 Tax=Haloplanus rubicundus TaxID=1547898 RepID=A0A345E8I3_9EURY|nr:tubulin-like doman-containing protein [Haloplanus rubicundus]AXG08505.1 hypothetical protein DU484_00840 [Haloplanus rubicundus]
MGVHQANPDLPDILVGLGGAGKAVVGTLLDQEWVAESIARTAAVEGFPSCYLVDADTGQLSRDHETADVITERLDKIVHQQHDGLHTGANDVVSVINLGAQLANENVEPTDLVESPIAETILEETEVETWWLLDDPTYLPEGFQHGTMRRRAVAKALPPAAEALTSGDPLDQIIPSTRGQKVTIVAGLGGGFGSGTAFDLARRMTNAGAAVTLFGILPEVNDVEHVRANAHAALSELEYLALTNDNPFENVVLIPTPGDLSDIQSFDEAIAYAVLTHANLVPGNRMMLDETQAAGPDQYAPFTVAIPQVLRFNVETVQRTLGDTVDWLHNRQQRLEVELDLYFELAEFIIEAFPEAQGPVIAHANDQPAPPEETPAEPMDDTSNLPVQKTIHLRRRIDSLIETLDGDFFEILDNRVAFDWLHALEQAVEDAEANTDDDDQREVLAHLVNSFRHYLLNNPVQGDPQEFHAGQLLQDVVRMELKAIIYRSRIHRTAHQMDDAVYRKSIRRATDGDHPFIPRELQHREEELGQLFYDQQDRSDAVEGIHHEVEKLVDHRIAEFREETHDAIETLVLIARHRDRIEELLDHVKELIHAFAAEIERVNHENELPEEPLDLDLLGELIELLNKLGIQPLNRERLLESAHMVVKARAAWLDQQGNILTRFFSDWPERYEQAYVQVDPELFDIPTAEEAERKFYCRFVGDQIFERPREKIEARRDQAIDDVIRAAERAADTTDIDVGEFQESAEDSPEIAWSGIDASWQMELREHLSSVSASQDPPSAGQVIGKLCDSGGTLREVVEEALLAPVERTLNAVQDNLDAIESDLNRTERLEEIIEEQGREFEVCTGGSEYPAPGSDLNLSERPNQYVRRMPGTVKHLLHQDSFAEADHPDEAAIEEFLDSTVYPFEHLDDRVGLAAGDVIGEGNAGPIPYDGHRVIRAHLGTVFGNNGGDLPADDALAEVVNAVGGRGNFVDQYFDFGDPCDVATVTFVGGVFLDNLAPVTGAQGYRSAYGSLRNGLDEQIRLHHAHGLDGRDRSLVESGDSAGFVYRDRVLDVRDHAAIGQVVADDENDAVEWILEECVATESFGDGPDSDPADDPGVTR